MVVALFVMKIDSFAASPLPRISMPGRALLTTGSVLTRAPGWV